MSIFDLGSAKKIVVTGGAGFLGRHVVGQLVKSGARRETIVIPRSSATDLRDPKAARELIKGSDLVVHLAARVGGIGFNQKFPGELYFDNAMMGMNVIESCRLENVKKVVFAGTICAYPRHTPVPFLEENLWNGYPEETNAPYGVAKKSMLVMLEAYRAQYGLNGIFLLPVNLYGPHDNFDLESSHVIPALIRKFAEAKRSGARQVTLWGDGSPTREFLYVEDAALGIVLATQKYNSSAPVNLGNGEEISIKKLAQVVQANIGYEGKIEWDSTRPNGQERRCLDVTKAKERFGFEAKVTFEDGLARTINWWMKNGA